MRKAIRLVVTLWIEGDAEPAHDFYASTSDAVHDIVEAGSACHPELRVTVERVTEASGSAGEDDDEDLLADED